MELHDSSIEYSLVRHQGPFMLALSRCMNNSRRRKLVTLADATSGSAFFTVRSSFIAFYPADSVFYERCDVVSVARTTILPTCSTSGFCPDFAGLFLFVRTQHSFGRCITDLASCMPLVLLLYPSLQMIKEEDALASPDAQLALT